MLTVVTPATNKRLTTVSTVREELGIIPDMATDDRVKRWIDQASQAIVDYCGRELVEQTYRETVFRDCRPFILERWPITQIVDFSYAGSALAANQYALDEDGLWRVGGNGRLWQWGPGQIITTYKAGYVPPEDGAPGVAGTVPATIQLACLSEIRAHRARADRDPMVRSETEDGVGSTTFQMASIGEGSLANPESAGLLARYRTMRVR